MNNFLKLNNLSKKYEKNKSIKVLNNINFKLQSMSYGGEKLDSDWRVLFELKKVQQ